jgi:hypothetical protein
MAEPKLVIEKDATLWCTPRGQVADLKSRTVFSFTQEKSRSLAHNRPHLSDHELKQTIAALLHLPVRSGVPEFRILRALGARKYPKPYATTYAVETERGVFALVYRLSEQRLDSRPPRDPAPAILYVAHHSSDAELHTEPLFADLLRDEPSSIFYTCDVRGIGESRPDTCGQNQFLSPYGSDYFYAIHALMLDRPYVGQKTWDVLRVLDWLRSYGHEHVHLVGRGWGSIPATFAALLSETVVRVTLKNALTSYRAIAESESYNWPLSSFVPDVLEKFDLPDCYRALEGKKLRQIDMWGANAGMA